LPAKERRNGATDAGPSPCDRRDFAAEVEQPCTG
jgi:hypothetical protein